MFRPVKSGSFAMKVGLDRDQVACDGWPGGEGGEFSNGDEENGLVVAQLVSLQIQQWTDVSILPVGLFLLLVLGLPLLASCDLI